MSECVAGVSLFAREPAAWKVSRRCVWALAGWDPLPAREPELGRSPHGQGTSPRARSAPAPGAGSLLRTCCGVLSLRGPLSQPPAPRLPPHPSPLAAPRSGASPDPHPSAPATPWAPVTLDTPQAPRDRDPGPSPHRACHAPIPSPRPRDTSDPPTLPASRPLPRGLRALAGVAGMPRGLGREDPARLRRGGRSATRVSRARSRGLPSIQNRRLRSPPDPAAAATPPQFAVGRLRVRAALVCLWPRVLPNFTFFLPVPVHAVFSLLLCKSPFLMNETNLF